ncbi:MAG: hypothetical protein QOI12_5174 [Alphaproteobacteria bacterium]|nr:hypothetical protein [Alphaproteobacteria bacterium]
MANFHIAHILPKSRDYQGMKGYTEIAQTLVWGLRELGHTVTTAVNEFASDATNIIVGAQVLPPDVQKQLPPSTIVYNLEQLRAIAVADLRDEIRVYAQDFQIWEYSPFNMPLWAALNTKYAPKLVPVGYAPILTRIGRPANQDIDVLLYGLPSEQRMQAFQRVASKGLVVVFLSGLYGDARDNLIGRSKVILNVTAYPSRIFEIVRVSYLLSNRKAVVSDLWDNSGIEDGFRDILTFSWMPGLAETCLSLVDDPAQREALENAGFEFFSKRDIRLILKNALQS